MVSPGSRAAVKGPVCSLPHFSEARLVSVDRADKNLPKSLPYYLLKNLPSELDISVLSIESEFQL
jgi:hypothetical protein